MLELSLLKREILKKTLKCLITCFKSHSPKEEESGLKSRSSNFKAHQPVWSLYINNLAIGLFPTDFGFLILSYLRGLRAKAFKVFNLFFLYLVIWCYFDITHLALLQEIIANMTCYSPL